MCAMQIILLRSGMPVVLCIPVTTLARLCNFGRNAEEKVDSPRIPATLCIHLTLCIPVAAPFAYL